MRKIKYVALFRGINVGKTKRIEMKTLRALFLELGYVQVSTYINSGNVFFESDKFSADLEKDISKIIFERLELQIPVLVKSQQQLQEIVAAIPNGWQNNETQRTDVAYLFPQVDRSSILTQLPLRLEYLELKYVPGALIWNVRRENVIKSHLNKLVGHLIYQHITVRNSNTAQYLAAK